MLACSEWHGMEWSSQHELLFPSSSECLCLNYIEREERMLSFSSDLIFIFSFFSSCCNSLGLTKKLKKMKKKSVQTLVLSCWSNTEAAEHWHHFFLRVDRHPQTGREVKSMKFHWKVVEQKCKRSGLSLAFNMVGKPRSSHTSVWPFFLFRIICVWMYIIYFVNLSGRVIGKDWPRSTRW